MPRFRCWSCLIFAAAAVISARIIDLFTPRRRRCRFACDLRLRSAATAPGALDAALFSLLLMSFDAANDVCASWRLLRHYACCQIMAYIRHYYAIFQLRFSQREQGLRVLIFSRYVMRECAYAQKEMRKMARVAAKI